jgi:hypothetical protein
LSGKLQVEAAVSFEPQAASCKLQAEAEAEAEAKASRDRLLIQLAACSS